MTQEEKRYYEIGEASYEWVGERGDTEFRLGAEWAVEREREKLFSEEEIRLYRELGNGLYELPGHIICNRKGLDQYLNEIREEIDKLKRMNKIDNTFVEMGVSEFDRRINSALKDFEHLPKEELIEVLEFYLNVVKNCNNDNR